MLSACATLRGLKSFACQLGQLTDYAKRFKLCACVSHSTHTHTVITAITTETARWPRPSH